jgi:hypothetical protein
MQHFEVRRSLMRLALLLDCLEHVPFSNPTDSSLNQLSNQVNETIQCIEDDVYKKQSLICSFEKDTIVCRFDEEI